MIWRRTAGYLWPYRWQIAVALAQVAALNALELLKPWPLQLVIDSVLGGHPAAWAPLRTLSPTELLAVAAGGLVAIYMLLGLVAVWNNYTTISVGQGMVNDLRSRFYNHLQRLSLSFHARAGVGDLLYRVTGDTYAIQTLAMNGFFPIASALLLLGGMTVIMLRLDVWLTLVAVGVAPLLLFGILLVNRRLSAAATELRERESEVYQIVQRNLSAIKIVQAFSREGLEHERFVAGSRASLRSGLRLYTMQTAYGAATNVLIACGTAAVLWVGAQQVWSGRLTVGEVVVFVSYLASLYAPINALVQTVGLVQGARAGVVRVFSILDAEPPMRDGTATLPEPVRGAVCFDHVDFSYPGGHQALHDIDLDVAPGECIAIVGATGAGKSTLVSLIARFYDPTAGQVRIDGCDVRTLRLDALRAQVSMVLQPPIVFPMSIHDNIAYGRPAATRADVVEAARLAQAHDFIARLPAGYDTIVGEQGSTLSEGERQRLTIARAVLRQAPILILDEPTASVDVTTEAAIMAGLERLMEGRTTFVIAHRLSTVRRASRIVVLREGAVVESGTLEALLARGGVFARMYATQFDVTTTAAEA
ncbi:MAG: ABC transporter ATP-binding protein [Deltaproteobacteria bacterium]|nr:ABC transporter ATP-binding protein [Deltaproteobacteria bacterium]